MIQMKHYINNTGFTLIELLVTISIILLLTGAGIAGFINFNDRQQVQVTVKQLQDYMRSAQVKARAGEGADTCDDSATPSVIEKLYGYRVTNDTTTVYLRQICINPSTGATTKNTIRSQFPLNNVTITKSTPTNPSSTQNPTFISLNGGVNIGNNASLTYSVAGQYSGITYEFDVMQTGEIKDGDFQ